MNFIKKNIAIVISLILACVAGILVFVLLKSSAPSIPVVVTAQNLSVGAEISQGDLEIKNFPSSAVPNTSFRSKEQIVGQTVVAGPIIQGDVVRAEHLSAQGSLLSTLITFAPKNWVAVALPEGAGQGMTGVRRGDVVDIYAETGGEAGISVYAIVKGAKIIGIPTTDKSKQYVVAVPEQYAPVVAEIMVRNKPVTIALPSSAN